MATGFVIQNRYLCFISMRCPKACTFTDFLQVMLHGLKLDCTIAGYLTAIPSPIDFSISLASGRLVEEGIERVLLDHGNSGIRDLFRRCGFIRLLGIQVGRYFILLPAIARRCDGGVFRWECSLSIIGIRGIYAKYLCLVHLHPPVSASKASFPPTGLEQLGSTFAILLAGGILFIPIRGGVTTSTANVGMVYFSQNQFLNHSAINPCFQSDSLIE